VISRLAWRGEDPLQEPSHHEAKTTDFFSSSELNSTRIPSDVHTSPGLDCTRLEGKNVAEYLSCSGKPSSLAAGVQLITLEELIPQSVPILTPSHRDRQSCGTVAFWRRRLRFWVTAVVSAQEAPTTPEDPGVCLAHDILRRVSKI